MAKGSKKIDYSHLGGIAAGTVLGGIVGGTKVSSMIPYIKDNEKLSFITPAAIGLVVKMVGKKSKFMQDLGTGMIGASALVLVGKNYSAAGIYGLSESDVNDVINGVINGPTPEESLAALMTTNEEGTYEEGTYEDGTYEDGTYEEGSYGDADMAEYPAFEE